LKVNPKSVPSVGFLLYFPIEGFIVASMGTMNYLGFAKETKKAAKPNKVELIPKWRKKL
jgi:hypothetical protein